MVLIVERSSSGQNGTYYVYLLGITRGRMNVSINHPLACKSCNIFFGLLYWLPLWFSTLLPLWTLQFQIIAKLQIWNLLEQKQTLSPIDWYLLMLRINSKWNEWMHGFTVRCVMVYYRTYTTLSTPSIEKSRITRTESLILSFPPCMHTKSTVHRQMYSVKIKDIPTSWCKKEWKKEHNMKNERMNQHT